MDYGARKGFEKASTEYVALPGMTNKKNKIK